MKKTIMLFLLLLSLCNSFYLTNQKCEFKYSLPELCHGGDNETDPLPNYPIYSDSTNS